MNAIELSHGARGFLQDLKVAVRRARKSPLQALVITLTLGLGIGATTTVFAVVDAVLLQPLPLRDPERLTFLWHQAPETGARRIPVAAPDVAALAANARTLEDVAFSNRVADVAFTAEGVAERLQVASVTQNFFSTLAVRPFLGRTFLPGEGLLPPDFDDDAPAPPNSIVLSHRLWQARFGADHGVIGRTLVLNGQPTVVVGVMPDGFLVPYPPGSGFPPTADAWLPLRAELSAMRRTEAFIDQDSDNSGVAIARLGRTVTPAAAEAELNGLLRRLPLDPASPRRADVRIEVAPLAHDAVRHVRPVLVALVGAAVLLYLVACLNVGGLLLAALGARRSELGIRSALGASRARLVRQQLAELGAHVAAGSVLGIGFAWGGLRIMQQLEPAHVPRFGTAGLHLPALGIACLGAVVAVAMVGAAMGTSVWRIGERRLIGAPSGGNARGRALGGQQSIVVFQLALAVVLASGGGLLVGSLVRLGAEEPGFEPDGALVFDMSLRAAERHRRPAARAALVSEVEARFRSLPDVQAVGVAGRLPLGERRWSNWYARDGEPADPRVAALADFRMVTPEYFRAIGTRIREGRTFTASENTTEDRRIVIVDEIVAGRVAPGASALGHFLTFPLDGREVRAEIVGVVEPVRFASLAEPPRGALYVPYRHEASRDLSIVIRTAGESEALSAAVRDVVRSVDPEIAVYNISSLRQYVNDSISSLRLAVRVLGAFAALAVGLALLGVYAQLSRSVARRRRELGVRLALGATRRTILRDVLGRGLVIASIGAVVGIGLTATTSRFLSAMLHGTAPADPVVLGGVGLAVALTALVAAAGPAWRAANTDPMVALREE